MGGTAPFRVPRVAAEAALPGVEACPEPAEKPRPMRRCRQARWEETSKPRE